MAVTTAVHLSNNLYNCVCISAIICTTAVHLSNNLYNCCASQDNLDNCCASQQETRTTAVHLCKYSAQAIHKQQPKQVSVVDKQTPATGLWGRLQLLDFSGRM